MRGGESEAVRIIGVPARRDANIGQAEKAFNCGPFADIVALGQMADPLQQVSGHEGADAPIPGPNEEKDDAADG